MPCPNCIIHTISSRPASEHVIRIYLSHEYLTRWGLHPHLALRSYISLIREVERRNPRGAIATAIIDGQRRCHGEVRQEERLIFFLPLDLRLPSIHLDRHPGFIIVMIFPPGVLGKFKSRMKFVETGLIALPRRPHNTALIVLPPRRDGRASISKTPDLRLDGRPVQQRCRGASTKTVSVSTAGKDPQVDMTGRSFH